MSFFIPSIESSSSKKKSNFCQEGHVKIYTNHFWSLGWTTHRWADRLVRRIMPDGEVRVLQCLFACNSLRGIEIEHLGEQIESERVRIWEQLRELHSRPDG
jgi:hypothetical protein